MPCGMETQRACSTFDGEIEKLIRADMIDYDTAMAYATNPGNLRLQLTDLGLEPPRIPVEKAAPPAKETKKRGDRTRDRITEALLRRGRGPFRAA